MNPSITGSLKPSTSTAPAASDAQHPGRPSGRDAATASSTNERNAFSRSLAQKQRQLLGEREPSGSEPHTPDQSPLQMMVQKSTVSIEAGPSTARGTDRTAMPSVTTERLALQSGLRDLGSAHATGLSSREAAQTWQTSLPAANGQSMQFTASYQPSAHAHQATWAVSVASPAAEAAAFARQAIRLSDRLHERLASRGIGVRVEVHGDDTAVAPGSHDASDTRDDRDDR